MILNISEIFDDVEFEISIEKKRQILVKYFRPAIQTILVGTFHPNILFFTDTYPRGYKKNDCPIGMGETNIDIESKRFYMFEKGYPMPDSRKEEKLREMLQSLEAKEADVVMSMLRKKPYVKSITKELVQVTFPGLINV